MEECDDGTDNGKYNKCKNDCSGLGIHCGDGIIESGIEECDDGNSLNSDNCLNSCNLNICGDGYVKTGGTGIKEQCDDGNNDNTDECTNICEIKKCGTDLASCEIGDTINCSELGHGFGTVTCNDACNWDDSACFYYYGKICTGQTKCYNHMSQIPCQIGRAHV